MTPCPGDAELRALLESSEPEACGGTPSATVRHLDDCEPCRRRLEELAGGVAWVPGEADLAQDLPLAAAAQVSASDPLEEVRALLQPTENPDLVGTIDEYDVRGVVGRGGMSVVLDAVHRPLGRRVALKVLDPALAASASFRERLRREARAAAAIRHVNVVTVYAVESERPLPYLVMEALEARSLEAWVRRDGPLSITDVVDIARQVARGLQAVHEGGIIHRDIKPANILIDRDGVAKIADFGIARGADDPSITAAGTCLGTPQYMSPEQALGRAVDERSDLFSVGSVLYSICAGTPPFGGETSLRVLREVCETPHRPIRELNPDVPAQLAAVIDRLLDKDPAGRFASAAELEDALDAIDLSADAPDASRKRVLPWLAAAAALATAVAVAVGLFGPDGSRAPPPRAPIEAAAPFAVLDADGGAVGAHATLEEALEAAESGAIVEVGGDGPFTVDSVTLVGKKITLRAARDRRPSLVLRSGSASWLTTDAALVLEGLTIGSEPVDLDEARSDRGWCFVRVHGAPFFAAGCRLLERYSARCLVELRDVPHAVLANCELYARSHALLVRNTSAAQPDDREPGTIVVENCVHAGATLIGLATRGSGGEVVHLKRSTLRSGWLVSTRGPSPTRRPFTVRVESNVLKLSAILKLEHPPSDYPALRTLMLWQGRDNIFDCDAFFDPILRPSALGHGPVSHKDVVTWNQFWGTRATGCLAGRAQFRTSLDKSWPVEFTAAPESFAVDAVYQGRMTVSPLVLKSRGAVTEQTGPGPPYHAWVESDAYAAWREEIAAGR